MKSTHALLVWIDIPEDDNGYEDRNNVLAGTLAPAIRQMRNVESVELISAVGSSDAIRQLIIRAIRDCVDVVSSELRDGTIETATPPMDATIKDFVVMCEQSEIDPVAALQDYIAIVKGRPGGLDGQKT